MIVKPVPVALTREGLLGKSKLFMQRAFRAKQADDLDEYQLWASLALELLGKAALSGIHPSLVADPTHSNSLFAASGMHAGTDIKTITSKTLYERIGRLSKYFDAKVQDFCDAISLRRNSELHSGEAPFQQMRLDAWESRFVHAAQIILDLLGSSLEEWLGANHARAPRELINEAGAAAAHAARERVAQAKRHFDDAHARKEREKIIEVSRTKHAFDYKNLFTTAGEAEWEVECPACSGQAFLAGESYNEEVLEEQPGGDGWEEQVEKHYGARDFRCPVCELHLDSREEIEAVGLEPEYVQVEAREREYEPDYGNC